MTPLKGRKDTYRHKGMRKKLAETVRNKGIKDERVIAAIEKIPRHLFLDEAFVSYAYHDTAFKIGEGQTISQPFTVAYQTELLACKSTDKVLEVGTGSGYQACVLGELVDKVFTIERYEKLFKRSTAIIRHLGYKNIKTFHGDGYQGLPAFAPYDKILITAAAPEIPEALKEQLKVGGHLVAPFGSGPTQVMMRLTKQEDGTFQSEKFDHFKFVPLVKGKA
jgi:protein-L-isoaspartate(D-aspartate) O-methyltransferase